MLLSVCQMCQNFTEDSPFNLAVLLLSFLSQLKVLLNFHIRFSNLLESPLHSSCIIIQNNFVSTKIFQNFGLILSLFVLKQNCSKMLPSVLQMFQNFMEDSHFQPFLLPLVFQFTNRLFQNLLGPLWISSVLNFNLVLANYYVFLSPVRFLIKFHFQFSDLLEFPFFWDV